MALRYFKPSETTILTQRHTVEDTILLLRTHTHFVSQPVFEGRSLSVYNNFEHPLKFQSEVAGTIDPAEQNYIQ